MNIAGPFLNSHSRPKSRNFVIRTSLIGSVGGLLFGYDLGVMNQALPLLTGAFELSTPQQELLTSLLIVGSVFGSLFGGFICDRIGRKGAIFVVCAVFVAGSGLIAFSGGLAQICVGRFVMGVGMSISAIADVAYLTELSPDKYRGSIVGTNELMITVGLFIAYLTGYALTLVSYGWRIMFGLPITISIIWIILMIGMPESPRWLLIQGREDEARLVYENRSDTIEEAHADLNSSIQEINDSKQAQQINIIEILFKWKYAMFLSIFLMFAQNLCGNAAVLTYTPEIFHNAGLSSTTAGVATITLGLIKVVTTAISMSLVDNIGRKPLLLWGIFGVMLSLCGLVIFTSQKSQSTVISGYFCIISTCSLVGSYALGFGPMCWLITSEFFTDDVRGRALGFATVFNWIGSLISVSSFLSLLYQVGPRLTFFIYLLICTFTFLVVYKLLPETHLHSPNTIKQEMIDRFHGVSSSYQEVSEREVDDLVGSDSKIGEKSSRNSFEVERDIFTLH